MRGIWIVTVTTAALLGLPAPAHAAAHPNAPATGTITVSTAGLMTVSWAPDSTADPRVASYTATSYDASIGGAQLGTCTANSPATTCTINMSPTTTTHYVGVTATNTSGTSPEGIRVPVPGSPSGLAITTSGSSATANWTALTGASSYLVTAYSASVEGTSQGTCTAIAPVVTCTMSGLTSAANYFFAVSASINTVTGPDSARVALCNGFSDLCSRPFNETVFAGTHNSMASDHAWGPFLSVNPVTTQTYTIREQLDRGIRALSFDVWYGRDVLLDVWNADGPTRSGVEPYLCHSYCTLGATPLEEGFEDVKGFLVTNPRAVVVIYFEDYVSVADTRAVVQSSGLSDYVFNWSGGTMPYTTTLSDMIATGKRVVFISQNVSTANQTQWYPRLTNIGMDTDYDFSETAQLTDPDRLAVSCDPTPWGRRGNGRVLVMQHFITDLIASSSDSAVVNTKAVLTRRALACQASRGVMPSILLVDYFEQGAEDGGVLGAARALNDLYSASSPRIANASPAEGSASGGTSITLTGTNLTGATAVTIGSSAATSVTTLSDSIVTALTPAGTTGRVNITVTTSSGSFKLWSGFTYGAATTPTAPMVTAVSPSSGVTSGGQTVTIMGANFTDAETVTFGGAPAERFTVTNDGSLTAVTPQGLVGPVHIEVVAEGGTGTLTGAFTYTEPVTPPPLNPSVNPETTAPAQATSEIALTAPPNESLLDSTITPEVIATMTLPQVAAITPSQAATFTQATVRAMSPQQVRALQPAAFARLTSRAIAALSAHQARQLRPRQVTALIPSQVISLSRPALRAFSTKLIASLGAKSRAALTPRQIKSLRPEQVLATNQKTKSRLTTHKRTRNLS